jgi:hypothetical protein
MGRPLPCALPCALPYALLLVVLLVVAAMVVLARTSPEAGATLIFGAAGPRRKAGPKGADYAKSSHIVVDTLNLAHWLGRASGHGRALTPDLIAEAIDRTAPVLLKRHPGRVMYVLKDRESQFNDEAAREVYRRAAERNKVYVLLAERYSDPPKGVAESPEHSAQGRDDFFIALLAHRWRCAVLTEDRLRDFDRFRATVQPFHVYEFAFWRALPHREFVRPESPAYARLKKPRMVRYAEYFPGR